MVSLLILLYVLQANQVVIPIGCFIAVWVLICISAAASIVKAIME